MSQHELLRERYEQHKIKNNYSKIEDAQLKTASNELIKILEETYPNHKFEVKAHLTFKQIEEYSNITFNIPFNYDKRRLEPDGGVIWMDNKYPILITEAKHQGTNTERIAEGKKKQATGNAIERLGKNLIGFRVLYHNDSILPFICFCSGCDFEENQQTVLCKLYTMNEFQTINKIYLDISDYVKQNLHPFSILTKVGNWSFTEIMEYMLVVAENSINYFEKIMEDNN